MVRLVVAVSTLLGPEGTTGPALGVGAPRCGWLFFLDVVTAWHGLAAYRPAVVGVGVVCGVVGGLLVENCIVDASILFSVVFVCG